MQSILRALLNRCPHCGEGPLFAGWLTLHETCPVCQARHERMAGSWTIATWISASIGIALGGVLAWRFPEVLWIDGSPLIPILLISCSVAMLSYRPVKAMTFGFLHVVGLVHPDPTQVGNVIYLERIRHERKRAQERADAERKAEGS